ncbi:MAG: sodium:alanine symporter family protein [Oscillospiraceae bacterium]|jgi:AGCS family alanine or glycine:cation symporter|nr:sodium:alanine symporter family protein [Oscillospiraceae bacterium]
MEAFANIVNKIDGLVWGLPMLLLLVGTHIFLTIRTRGIQRHILRAIRLSVSKDAGAEGDISQFAALSTALAATIGTGNIIGVSSAIVLGGPGAVLWCWLTGVFGIATKYGEGLLAVKYRVKTSDGTMLGGPMYALERGARLRWLAVVFALFTAVAAFGIGSGTQSNALAAVVKTQFGVDPLISSIVVTAITAVVLLGGVRWISRVCSVFVPVMALLYVAGCVVLLVLNGAYLGETVRVILREAFSLRAAGGGFAGTVMMAAARYGVARGLFSNESGLGSAPIAAAAARTRNPVRQALVSMTGTFWDTVVVCAMTGLVLVSSVLKAKSLGASAELNSLTGGDLTGWAFGQIRVLGPIILTGGIIAFVFSSILGWSYYGERAVEYLFGKSGVMPYKILYVASVFFGGVASLTLVWDISDALNGLMAIPNIISLLLLSNVIVKETKKYLWDGRLDDVDLAPVPELRRRAKKKKLP